MEEKRKDLISEKRKVLLQRLMEDLSRSHPDFYYQSTNEIALAIKEFAEKDARLTQDDKALIDPLTWRDIQVILSLH